MPRRRRSGRQRSCSNAGVGVAALDDYGTADSTLALLQVLPLRTVKIAKSFIGGIAAAAAPVLYVLWRVVFTMPTGARIWPRPGPLWSSKPCPWAG